MKPYREKKNIRIFDKNIDPTELKWHFDEENRIIKIIDCGLNKSWLFQFNDELPIELYNNQIINIPIGKYHRLIKNNNLNNLIIKKYEY